MVGWIILFVVLLAILNLFLIIGDSKLIRKCPENIQETAFFISLCIFAVGLLTTAILSIVDDNGCKTVLPDQLEPTLMDTKQLVSMAPSQQIEGRSNLTFGYIQTDGTYRFMYKMSDGGYQAISVNASDTMIYETNENYRLEVYENKVYDLVTKNETALKYFKIFWRKPVDGKTEIDFHSHFLSSDEKTTYKAFVPTGSVKTSFTVN